MTTTKSGAMGGLLAAALLAGQPVLAQELIITRPAPAPAAPARPAATTVAPLPPVAAPSSAQPAASAVSNTPVSSTDELPTGAPADDYEFLGWCTGILTGHMQLYPKVKPELDAIAKRWNSVDSDARQEAAQQVAGKELLGQFRHAMGTVEAASPTPISLRGQTAVQKGLATWTSVDKLDKQNQAYSWMNFGLPGRCENKAAEVEKSGGKIKTAAMATPAAKPAVATPAAAPATAKPAAMPAKPAVKPAAKPAAKSATAAKDAGLRH
jgi:hypothetical protein